MSSKGTLRLPACEELITRSIDADYAIYLTIAL